MTTAADTCPGCHRVFAPRGFLNHLRLSRDPRCASARDRLQPTYPHTLGQEPPPPSPTTDFEMIDLTDTEPTTPPEQYDQITADTDDNSVHDENPQSQLEEAPDLIARSSNTQDLIVFDSDAEDSDDDDGNQDLTSRSEAETPPSPTRSMMHTCKPGRTTQAPRSDRNLSVHQNNSSQPPSNPDPARFVVKFLGAGEVLEMQPSQVGYQQYASCLGTEENEPTEWAPFSTRREWEVARWAKLRGPSSTALSELLRIDGVGWSILTCSTRTKSFFSFRKHSDCHFQTRTSLTRLLIKNSRMDFHSLFERKSNLQDRNMSFITVIYSNVSEFSMVIQNLRSVWFTPPKSTILARTKSPGSFPR